MSHNCFFGTHQYSIHKYHARLNGLLKQEIAESHLKSVLYTSVTEISVKRQFSEKLKSTSIGFSNFDSKMQPISSEKQFQGDSSLLASFTERLDKPLQICSGHFLFQTYCFIELYDKYDTASRRQSNILFLYNLHKSTPHNIFSIFREVICRF